MEASIIVTNQPQTCRIGILTNHRWERPVVLNLGHSDFEIVSDSCPPSFWRIVLRISDFKLSAPLSPNSLIPCSADPLQPVPLIPRSLLLSLSPVSCLLSSVFCLPSSVFCLPSSALPAHPSQIAGALQMSSALYKSTCFLQNKANVKMGNINISAARTKGYAKEQRTISNERYSKQTQSNPIPARREAPAIRKYAIRRQGPLRGNTRYAIRNTNPIPRWTH